MDNTMKVSIITVCYNCEKTLQDTIQSVSLQDYPNIEYIVVDGGSTDGTMAIVHQNKRHIAAFVSEPDLGIYDAMNKGLLMATGHVIGMLNADDILENNQVVSAIARAFQEKPEVACVYGDLLYVAANNPQKVIRTWRAGVMRPHSFLNGWMPPHPTFYVKKSVYEACGPYDLSFPLAADYEFMLRVLIKHKKSFAYLPIVLVRMRMGGASNSSLLSRKQSFKENKAAWSHNGLKPRFYTIYLKVFRKLSQYFFH
jgi:glycosyltransferase involved in cell wall biosynthesis